MKDTRALALPAVIFFLNLASIANLHVDFAHLNFLVGMRSIGLGFGGISAICLFISFGCLFEFWKTKGQRFRFPLFICALAGIFTFLVFLFASLMGGGVAHMATAAAINIYQIIMLFLVPLTLLYAVVRKICNLS